MPLYLAVATAAMKTTTSMEASGTGVEATAAAVESTARCEPAATNSAAYKAATNRPASNEASVSDESTAADESATSEPTAKSWSTEEPAPTEPRSGADEDATGEPVRPVIAVRCTSIRGIAVVAIGADGGNIVTVAIPGIHWAADSYSDRNSLGIRE